MLVSQTHAVAHGQRHSVAHVEQRRIGLRRRAIELYDTHLGIVLQLVAQTDDGTYRQLIAAVQPLLPLHTKVKLVAVDGRRVLLRQGVRGRRCRRYNRTVDGTPQIGSIDTHRERLCQTGTHTEVHLVQTAAASILFRHAARRTVAARRLIVVANIRERQHAERHTDVLPRTERRRHILERGVRRITADTALLVVRRLSRQSHVEKHGQRVNVSIRCRVERIHLVALVQTVAHAVHTAAHAL